MVEASSVSVIKPLLELSIFLNASSGFSGGGGMTTLPLALEMGEAMIFESSNYGLDTLGLPVGASLGLHASGLPSGAQHAPFTVP
jgi:hypothetical protein